MMSRRQYPKPRQLLNPEICRQVGVKKQKITDLTESWFEREELNFGSKRRAKYRPAK